MLSLISAMSRMHSDKSFPVMTLPTCMAKAVLTLIRCILPPLDLIHLIYVRAEFGRIQVIPSVSDRSAQ